MHRLFVSFVAILICLDATQAIPTTTRPNLPMGHDILEILPLARIEEIERQHLKNDDGFKAALLVLQGDEWKKLVAAILSSVEYARFAEMAAKYKFNLTQAAVCLRNHIDSLKVEASKVTAKPNLEPFVTDIQKSLPIGQIAKALSNTNNPEAMRVRQELGSDANRKLAEALHDLPQMVKLRDILKMMNFDIEPYIALVYAFLGWA